MKLLKVGSTGGESLFFYGSLRFKSATYDLVSLLGSAFPYRHQKYTKYSATKTQNNNYVSDIWIFIQQFIPQNQSPWSDYIRWSCVIKNLQKYEIWAFYFELFVLKLPFFHVLINCKAWLSSVLCFASDHVLMCLQGVTYCGESSASSLTMANVPWHQEVVAFVQQLADMLPQYEIACEHEHSNCLLIAHTKVRTRHRRVKHGSAYHIQRYRREIHTFRAYFVYIYIYFLSRWTRNCTALTLNTITWHMHVHEVFCSMFIRCNLLAVAVFACEHF